MGISAEGIKAQQQPGQIWDPMASVVTFLFFYFAPRAFFFVRVGLAMMVLGRTKMAVIDNPNY